MPSLISTALMGILHVQNALAANPEVAERVEVQSVKGDHGYFWNEDNLATLAGAIGASPSVLKTAPSSLTKNF